MITNVSVAVMYVADQDASLNFYVNQLGFEKIRDEEMWPGARWIEARPPGAQTAVVFSNAADFGKEPGEGAYLTFACDDVDAGAERDAVARLTPVSTAASRVLIRAATSSS